MKQSKKIVVALAISMGIGVLGGSSAYAENLNLYGAETDELQDLDKVKCENKGVTTNPKNATGNDVVFTVNAGSWNYIYAGYDLEGRANNNSVTINEGVEVVEVYGGLGKRGEANGNQVTLNSTVAGVAGGCSHTNTANNNIVTINGKIGEVYGGLGKKADVNGNKVTLNGIATEIVYGGYSLVSGTANDNTVNINGTAEKGGYGGYSSDGTANNNTVIINGTVENYVVGGSGETESNGNKVFINRGGIVKSDVFGGVSASSTANANEVLVAGQVAGSVYVGSASAAINVKDNILNLGSADDSEGKAIIGGNGFINAWWAGESDFSTGGGTLNVYNSGNTIGGNLYADGANINFFINPSDMTADGSKTMLDVVGIADVTNAKIKAGVRNLNDIKVAYGSKINLLKAGTLKANGATYEAIVSDGFIDRKLKLEQNDNSIIATATASDLSSAKAKSPMETQISSISIINTGSDLISNKSFADAAKAIEKNSKTGMPSTMAPFTSIGGSSMRQNSGSYVDTKSWNIGVGFAKDVKNDNGKLMFGPIIEYGRGKYDSYLDDGTHGSGDSSFWGIGAIIKQGNNDGLYYEGSLRIGQAKNDYKSSDVLQNSSISYDTSAIYYAVHAGIGKVVSVGNGNSLDYYCKLFYSHQNGDRVNINGVDGNSVSYDFSAIDSFRTKLGLRYNYDINIQNTIYAGLAWQHEFSGSARATIHSSDISVSAPSPSIKGDTGIVEIGWKLNPTNGSNFEMDLGLNGAFGKQRGFGGTANFIWHF